MNDLDDFDASGLRRLDRAHRPRAGADEKIRRQMLHAFDAATTAAGQVDEADGQSPEISLIQVDHENDNDNLVLLELELGHDTDEHPALDSPNWLYRVAVAAAIAMLVGIGVILSIDGPETITPAEQNEAAVAEFCTTEFDDLVDVFVEYHRNPSPNSEFEDRALRNLELLSQAYADLSAELADPLSAEVERVGSEFLDRAAEVRVDLLARTSNGTPESMTLLIADLATAIDQLPNSSSCRTTDLRGG
jgi:hypothetical protein